MRIDIISCKERKFMKNKEFVKKLKDNAELAQAAYGYYDLVTSNTNQLFLILKDEKGRDIIDSNKNPIRREINLTDIMNSDYAGHNVVGKYKYGKRFEAVGTLKGDFTPTQAKNFFEKYELLDFYPKFDTKNNEQVKGFHACLFQNKETKEYTFAIRGSFDSKDYIEADIWNLLMKSSVPKNYFEKMLNFYKSCAKTYPIITQPKSLNVVGHSLGGCLAQLFALSFATTESTSIIKEVYTFNSPGAKNLKPPYDMLIFIPKATNYTIKESLFELHKKAIEKKAKALNINGFGLDRQIQIKLKEMIYNPANANTYFGISFFARSGKDIDYAYYISYEAIPYDLFQPYQTLINNYDNKNTKNYILGDKVFHIESKNQANRYHHTKESRKENAIQHLGKDIEGNYFILNFNFGGMDSHSITAISKLLYFYDYLYQNNENLIDRQSKGIKIEYGLYKEEFLKEHLEIDTQEYSGYKKALEYCNKIAFAINRILHNIEVQKALAISSNDDIYFQEPPNWLYAIIEQRVFEATIKTKQNKFLIKEDTSDIIEAILYLQENNVYIQILEENIIKNITLDSPLSQLFAIQESSFFISIDENANPLIKDTHTANRLIGYKTPRAQIFCGHSKAADVLVNCYKDATLKHYPKVVNE